MTESFTISAATTESSGLISPESQRGKRWRLLSSGYIRITSANASIMKRSRLVSTRYSRSTREGEWPTGKSQWKRNHSPFLQRVISYSCRNTSAIKVCEELGLGIGVAQWNPSQCKCSGHVVAMCGHPPRAGGEGAPSAHVPPGASPALSLTSLGALGSWGANKPGCVLVQEKIINSEYFKISGRPTLFLLLLMDPEVAKPHPIASFLIVA